MGKDIEYYKNCFENLGQELDKANGYAPHRPILLLGLVSLFDPDGELFLGNNILIEPNDKRFSISIENLEKAFEIYWNEYEKWKQISNIKTNHKRQFHLPCYTLKNHPCKFWKLNPKSSYNLEDKKQKPTSDKQLKERVESIAIENKLAYLLKQPQMRNELKSCLLNNKSFSASNVIPFAPFAQDYTQARVQPSDPSLYPSSQDDSKVIGQVAKKILAVTSEEANIAGFNHEDVQSMEKLERQLAEWDYTKSLDAQHAYSGKNIICLQLLRQIKYLTYDNKLIELRNKSGMRGHNDIGPSMLYDALANAKSKSKSNWTWVRNAVRSDGGKLQEAWDGLGQSTDITNFVNKYKSYLEGYIGSDNKWHSTPASQNLLSPVSQPSDFGQTTPPDELATPGQTAPNFAQGDAQDSMQQPDPGRLSQEEREAIGQEAKEAGELGEKLVNTYFNKLRREQKILTHEWTSKNNPTSPYDFRVTDNSGITSLLDVKSTKKEFARAMSISNRQIDTMAQNIERYDLYRVYELDEKGGKLRIVEGMRNFAQSILDITDNLPTGIRIESFFVEPKQIKNFSETLELSFSDEDD